MPWEGSTFGKLKRRRERSNASPPPHIVIGFGLSASTGGKEAQASLRFLTLFFFALAFSAAGTLNASPPPHIVIGCGLSALTGGKEA
jgi:hypothetical protein